MLFLRMRPASERVLFTRAPSWLGICTREYAKRSNQRGDTEKCIRVRQGKRRHAETTTKRAPAAFPNRRKNTEVSDKHREITTMLETEQ